MRKDIKKRLERALITLKEPGGSTIRSIIKVINKDSPSLSVRRVLEALQEGISEGFLCMYNGRFKLKQLIESDDENKDDRKEDNSHRSRGYQKTKTPVSDKGDDGSLYMSDEEEDDDDEEDQLEFEEDGKAPMMSKKSARKRTSDLPSMKRAHNHSSKKSHSRRKNHSRYLSKENNLKRKQKQHRKLQKHCRGSTRTEGSLLELSAKELEKSGRPTAERPDLKKQRGPRCTSMKKDVMIPSKVHIPTVPPSVPQKSNNFNELLRRSPEPVNGPLFDSISLTANYLGFF